jgi:membrane protein DedA with SNARE-associated domain
MTSTVDQVLTLNPVAVCLVVGALVFAEDALFLGFVIPGETAAVLGGVSAGRGHVLLPVIAAVVVVAAIVGDSVGYEVGRHGGKRLLSSRLIARHQERLQDAQRYLATRGGWAVFLGRWVAFFRAVMPALAGASRMPYPKFLAFNTAGGIVWGLAVVLLGYLAGNSYSRIEQLFGRGAALAALLIVVGGFIVWRIRRRRHRTDEASRGFSGHAR